MKEGNFISQEKYTRYLLKRFKMDDCKPINGYLELDEGGTQLIKLSIIL
jgi:hypothetical protein